jgi:glycosyltransferase involved in cell wall biosynthesis
MDKITPKLSIITVCFNAAPLIQKTLFSALNQSFQDFELVIVDGGSKDNTLALLQPFQSKIGEIVSEQDNGIYDAMNKGVNLAKGEWVYFLNAGDAFFDDLVLEKVFNEIKLASTDFLYAKVQTLNEPTGIDYVAGEEVTLKDFWHKYPICHQATFAKREIFNKVGIFTGPHKTFGQFTVILFNISKSSSSVPVSKTFTL